MRRADFTSIFILAMSTPVGQSRLQPLQLTHRSIALATASEVSASAPSWPVSASRSVLARPRVRWISSRVTRKDGHIVPASNFRQWPLLLHISVAFAKPPLASPPLPGSVSASVRGSFCTFHADQSSAGLYSTLRVARLEAEQLAVVHLRRPHDLAGIEPVAPDRTGP